MSNLDRGRAIAEVLQANASFYQAFTEGDLRMMAELWSRRASVTCLHPGMEALVGRAAVMHSWEQILREPPALPMRCDYPDVHLYGETALVLCYEGSGRHNAHLAATNLFVLERMAWKMVHHHAGPLSRPIASRAPTELN